MYLNGHLLHCRKTNKSGGHRHKANPFVTVNGKKVGRPPAANSKFSFYFEHTIHSEHDVNVRVCQKEFYKVHGFGPKRLQVLRKKFKAGELQPDQRGKHGNHQFVGKEVKDKIRAHILSYPARHSPGNSHRIPFS